jgi:predicted proteasome-type protease
MTYCLALRLDEGLVFLADTRSRPLDQIGRASSAMASSCST